MRRDHPTASTRILPILVSGLLLASAPPSVAGGWESLGPFAGQPITVLAAAPVNPEGLASTGAAFAGGRGVLFRTGDVPRTWRFLSDGLPPSRRFVTDLLVHPGTPDLILLSGLGVPGILRSSDGGSHWRAIAFAPPSPDPSSFVLDLAAAAGRPGTVFAGTRAFVFRSRDGGLSWERLGEGSAGTAGFEARHLAVAPSAPDTVYAAGSHPGMDDVPGLFKTTDGGESWTSILTGGSGIQVLFFTDLAVDPRAESTVYTAGGLAGVQKSTDGGMTWTAAREGLPQGVGNRNDDEFAPVTALVFDPFDPETLYAAIGDPGPGGGEWGGVYRTTDGGESWIAAWDGLPAALPVRDLAFSNGASPTLLAATAHGVYATRDGGATWQLEAGGMGSHLTAIAAPSEGLLYAGSDGTAAFRSGDAGETWQAIDGWSAQGGREVRALTASAIEPELVLLSSGIAGIGGLGRAGVFRSRDGGDAWDFVGGSLPPFSVGLLESSPIDPERIYASSSAGLFESLDAGETWRELRDRRADSLAFGPLDPSVLVAGSFVRPPDGGSADLGAVERSLDGGDTWLPGGRGLPPGHTVEALAIPPGDPSTVYAGLETTVFDGTTVGGVFISRDGGESFTARGEGLPELGVSSLAVRTLAVGVPPAEGGDVLYAGTYGAGVFRSVDGGRSWTPLSSRPGDGWVEELGFDPGTGELLAATRLGLFRLTGDVPGPPAPPGQAWLTDAAYPGFRFEVRIHHGDGQTIPGTKEPDCIPETVCFSGAVPRRSEVFLRIVGPKPNGWLWPNLVKFSTSRIEVWIQQLSTGRLRYYELPGATPGSGELPGLIDRFGFLPD